MKKERLYLALKNQICENIFRGLYQDGDSIPPERVLAETLEVSRVTVRKALYLLEEDGIIERVQGSGTIVNLRETGYEGDMDIIALLAPAQNPFFSLFIDHFQQNAENHDSLVLFKQKPKDMVIEDCLFKLFQKNIRNGVIWLEDKKIQIEYLRRLRGLGMNLVFFDIAIQSKYADCVSVDNRHGILSLYHYLKEKGIRNIAYIGWDNDSLSSVKERETAFRELRQKNETIYPVPWEKKAELPDVLNELAEGFVKNKELPEAIICGDGEIGIALKKVIQSLDIGGIEVASMDALPESDPLSMSVYRQSYDKMAESVYQCLLKQNQQAMEWNASVYQIQGELLIRNSAG